MSASRSSYREAERRGFWDDVDEVAAAVAAELEPAKLNYEIHGNTLPHLHLHLYPRTEGDRFQGRPIDGREASPRSESELRRLRETLKPLAKADSGTLSDPPSEARAER